MGIWGYYVAANYLGSFLCFVLLFSAGKNPRRTSLDVYIGALCFGCVWLSLSCGTECLLSMINGGRFYGGDWACKFEAIFHISSILMQFLSVTMISVRSYLSVVKQYTISVSAAFQSSILIFVICLGGTIGLSYDSPIYLMSAGTYCFFAFSSPAIAYWLIPGLGFALAVTIFCYGAIAYHAKKSSNSVRRFAKPPTVTEPNQDLQSAVEAEAVGIASIQNTNFASVPNAGKAARSPRTPTSATIPDINDGNPLKSPTLTANKSALSNDGSVQKSGTFSWRTAPPAIGMRIVLRSAWFVAVLFLGWGFAAVASAYELDVGLTPEWLVTAVGVGGVTHSVAVPLLYTYSSAYHRKTMRLLLACHIRKCCRFESEHAPFRGSRLTIAVQQPQTIPKQTPNVFVSPDADNDKSNNEVGIRDSPTANAVNHSPNKHDNSPNKNDESPKKHIHSARDHSPNNARKHDQSHHSLNFPNNHDHSPNHVSNHSPMLPNNHDHSQNNHDNSARKPSRGDRPHYSINHSGKHSASRSANIPHDDARNEQPKMQTIPTTSVSIHPALV